MLRAALLTLLVVAVFLPLNWVTVRQLLRLHPRGRFVTLVVAAIANVMWFFLPLLNARTPFSRTVRAIFGPPWFAWLCFALLYTAFLLLVALVWLPFRRRCTFLRFAHAPSLTFLLIVALGSVVGFYDAVVPLRIERVPVAIEGLPPRLAGTKIALLADLHVGLFTRSSRVEQFFRRTSALRPDVVILDGDLIDDDPYFVPKLLAAMQPLDPSIPVVAVLGNHEMYGDPYAVIRDLQKSRIHLLVNQGISVHGLWLAGVSDYAARALGNRTELIPDIDAALESAPAGDLPIVIAHQPRVFEEARARHVKLSLVAHTHGGQLGIRSLHWSLAGLFLPYHMGLYHDHGSQLYVNTGTGFWLLPFRLGMTPEITLIELQPAK